jgi:hypothetical protein
VCRRGAGAGCYTLLWCDSIRPQSWKELAVRVNRPALQRGLSVGWHSSLHTHSLLGPPKLKILPTSLATWGMRSLDHLCFPDLCLPSPYGSRSIIQWHKLVADTGGFPAMLSLVSWPPLDVDTLAQGPGTCSIHPLDCCVSRKSKWAWTPRAAWSALHGAFC